MDPKWLEQQTEEIGMALAKQGVRIIMPWGDNKQTADSDVVIDKIASYIDHTLLKPTAAKLEVKRLCREAKEYQFASVCVNPIHVSAAKNYLKESSVKVCTVVGFPLGATTTLSKVLETRDAVAGGADEVDMVVNIGALLERDFYQVYSDIKAIRDAACEQTLKVILETGYLSKEEIVRGCILAKMAGADFVKTSTGFGPGGATVEDVRLMKDVVGSDLGVKASGGIRDYTSALEMIKAGASRIGASAGIAIVKGLRGESEY